MADEGNDPNRPSFSDFWKKSKEALGGKKIRFVDGTPGQGSGSGPSGQWLQLVLSSSWNLGLLAGCVGWCLFLGWGLDGFLRLSFCQAHTETGWVDAAWQASPLW
jgi:hypothetical protein